MARNPLKPLPSVNELLAYPRLRGLLGRISQNTIVATVRTVLDEVGTEVQTAASEMALPSVSELAERIARRVTETDVGSLRPVVNATGILLAADTGPFPLAESAVRSAMTVLGEHGSGGGRASMACEKLAAEATGAAAAMVTANDAGALLLALSTLAGGGKEVVVARGQLIETTDRCRLTDLAGAGRFSLREIGSTCRVTLDDYAQALGPDSGAIALLHPLHYAMMAEDPATGERTSPVLGEIVAARANYCKTRGKNENVPVVVDVGLGPLGPLPFASTIALPSGRNAVDDGADVVLIRADGLTGGPRCGLLVGKSRAIESIRRHPLAGAFAATTSTLAALEATLLLARQPDRARRGIPLWHCLNTSSENLENRARRLAPQIAASKPVRSAEAVAATSSLRGLPPANEQCPSWCVAIEPLAGSPVELSDQLRRLERPVLGRIDADRNALMLDLRTVPPDQDAYLASAFVDA